MSDGGCREGFDLFNRYGRRHFFRRGLFGDQWARCHVLGDTFGEPWAKAKFNVYWFFRLFPCYFGFHKEVTSIKHPEWGYTIEETYCEICGKELN